MSVSKAAARKSFWICALVGSKGTVAPAERNPHRTEMAAVATFFRKSRRLAEKCPHAWGRVGFMKASITSLARLSQRCLRLTENTPPSLETMDGASLESTKTSGAYWLDLQETML